MEDADVKPNQVRIRISDDAASVLDALGRGVLSRTDIATYLLNAAVEAVKENGGWVHMPPRLLVVDERPTEYRLNEKSSKKR
jgi:hypothetical protein